MGGVRGFWNEDKWKGDWPFTSISWSLFSNVTPTIRADKPWKVNPDGWILWNGSFDLHFFSVARICVCFIYFGRANSSSSLWFLSCWVNQIICTNRYVCIFEYTHIWFFNGNIPWWDEIECRGNRCSLLYMPSNSDSNFRMSIFGFGPNKFLKVCFLCFLLILPFGWWSILNLLGFEQLRCVIWYHWCHPRFAASNLALLGYMNMGGLISSNEMNES